MSKAIYLAGKITRTEWRSEIVDGIDNANCTMDYSPKYREFVDPVEWPVLPSAIFKEFDYTGPYYTVDNQHGLIDEGFHGWLPMECHTARHGLSFVADLSWRAIARADMVFAWIDSLDAHGTYAEVGMARALGKWVMIGSPQYIPELWFIYALAHGATLQFSTPVEALRSAVEHLRWLLYAPNTESPIEDSFWRASCRCVRGIIPQVNIGKYRVDFAIPEHHIAIELDGHDYHKSKEQRTHDAKRERYLEREGWRVIRFTGSEVYKDVDKCVGEVLAYIATLQ